MAKVFFDGVQTISLAHKTIECVHLSFSNHYSIILGNFESYNKLFKSTIFNSYDRNLKPVTRFLNQKKIKYPIKLMPELLRPIYQLMECACCLLSIDQSLSCQKITWKKWEENDMRKQTGTSYGSDTDMVNKVFKAHMTYIFNLEKIAGPEPVENLKYCIRKISWTVRCSVLSWLEKLCHIRKKLTNPMAIQNLMLIRQIGILTKSKVNEVEKNLWMEEINSVVNILQILVRLVDLIHCIFITWWKFQVQRWTPSLASIKIEVGI